MKEKYVMTIRWMQKLTLMVVTPITISENFPRWPILKTGFGFFKDPDKGKLGMSGWG